MPENARILAFIDRQHQINIIQDFLPEGTPEKKSN